MDHKLVERLERTGVNTGYRVDIDPAAPGMPVTAYARIRAAAGQLVRVAGLGQSMCHVSARTTGSPMRTAFLLAARRLDGAAR